MTNKNHIKLILQEELTKGDEKKIASISKKEAIKYLKSSEAKNEIKKMMKDAVKGKGHEDIVVDIVRNMMVQLFRELWIKRNLWKSNIHNRKV
jgi:hypothetical protein